MADQEILQYDNFLTMGSRQKMTQTKVSQGNVLNLYFSYKNNLVLAAFVTGGNEITSSPSKRQGYTDHFSTMWRYWWRPETWLLFFSFLQYGMNLLPDCQLKPMRAQKWLQLTIHKFTGRENDNYWLFVKYQVKTTSDFVLWQWKWQLIQGS